MEHLFYILWHWQAILPGVPDGITLFMFVFVSGLVVGRFSKSKGSAPEVKE